MGRIKTDIDKNMAILSGKLGEALLMHAAQRADYFFFFLFCHKALSDRLRDRHGLVLANGEGVDFEKATHQIATGQRSKNKAYYDFVDQDPTIITQSATAAGARDAAHYCNLGIDAGFLKRADQFARPGVDDIAFKLRDMLAVMAGATRELPQRVNIGPDRIVDQVHGRLAKVFLDGTPPLTAARYSTYLGTCATEMTTYRDGHAKLGNLGLAACCDCYLAFYGGSGLCKSPWTPDGVWQMLCGQIEGECAALGLDRNACISTLVH